MATTARVYAGNREQQDAAYLADRPMAALQGWKPMQRDRMADSMRVIYERADPRDDGPVANWPGIAPRLTPPPPGASPIAFALSQAVAFRVSQGYRVQSQDAYSVVLVTGHRVNHLLHALVTVFLLGLWLFVWIPLAIFGGEKRVLITMDGAGRVNERPA